MPFNQFGQFVPNMQVANAGNQATGPTPFQPQAQPTFMAQNAMTQGQPNVQNFQAQQPQLQSFRMPPNFAFGGPQQNQLPPAITAQQNGSAAQPQANQGLPSQSGQPQQQWQPWGGPQFGVPQGMAQNAGQSVQQQVQAGNPQSVQNFMSALNQVGAGSNNRQFNAAGQQGAGPVGGFQGFGQNGIMAPNNGAVMAGGPNFMNSNIMGNQAGWQNNMAQGGSNYQAGNSGGYGQLSNMVSGYGGNVQAGGGALGGGPGNGNLSGWSNPQPWGQPLNNAPGWPGSGYSNDTNGFGQFWSGNPAAGTQAGSYYSGQGTIIGGQGPQGNQPGPNPNVVSDINAKTNITPAEAELTEFLNALGIYSYEYKDKNNGEGRRISPMAQEIEKSQLGKAAISTNPQGYKQVDYGKLAGTQLAALALLNHKYNKLEAQLKSAILTGLKAKSRGDK
jgi:hypothetical protein